MTAPSTCVGCALHCQMPAPLQACGKRAAIRRDWLKHPEYGCLANQQQVSAEEAIQRVQGWLQESRWSWMTGAWDDVATSRAMVRLAKQVGGLIAMWDGESAFAAIDTTQKFGAFLTTFNQVRTQSRPLVLLGDDSLLDAFPMLAFRLAPLNPQGDRSLKLVGTWSDEAAGEFVRVGWKVERWQGWLAGFPTGLMALARGVVGERAALAGPFDVVYGLDWLPGVQDRRRFQSELTQAMMAWNEQQGDLHPPSMLLPLQARGSTARAVTTWLTGFPDRVRWRKPVRVEEDGIGEWDYQPHGYAPARLGREPVEVVVWVDESVEPRGVPNLGCRMVVLGSRPPNEEWQMARNQDWLYFPTWLPGVDFSTGRMRADQGSLDRVWDPLAGRILSGRRASEWILSWLEGVEIPAIRMEFCQD